MHINRHLPRVSTHSRPKAAGFSKIFYKRSSLFQLTAARRRLAILARASSYDLSVSTHSRPKAAGCRAVRHERHRCRFNSQPPEGGWASQHTPHHSAYRFQLTAARRRLATIAFASDAPVRFNSQPPEGGWFTIVGGRGINTVSTHSRPKAAGAALDLI